jgi:hypothetical protein
MTRWRLKAPRALFAELSSSPPLTPVLSRSTMRYRSWRVERRMKHHRRNYGFSPLPRCSRWSIPQVAVLFALSAALIMLGLAVSGRLGG